MAPAKKNITQKQNPAGKNLKNLQAKQPAKHWARKYLYPVLIVFSCLVLYGNTFNSDYTEDDAIYTKANSLIKQGFSDVKYLFTKGTMYGCDGTNGYNYRPLTLLTFMTETSLFGLNPHVFQRFNVLYFALTCLILFFFLKIVLKKYNPVVPLAATFLFVFHPIHTDAVANFKSQDEILALMFGLLCLYLLLQYDIKQKLKYYYLSIGAFICALLCKETSVTYLVIIPLVFYFFTSVSLKKIARIMIPFAGVIAIYLFIHKLIFGSLTSSDQISIMNNSLMAAKNAMDMYATNFVMLGKYLYMLFVPYPLSWDYSYPQFPIVSWANPYALVSLLAYIIMGVLIIKGIKKKSIYSFAMLFYLVTLFPTCNLVLKIACSFGERFLFSPSVGFCMAIPVLLASGLKLSPGDKTSEKIKTYYGIIGGILVVYAFILIPRNMDWKNDYTLFKSGVITSPNSGRTHGALGSMYMDTAQSSENPAKRAQFYALAAHEFKRVTELFTMDPDGYYNLGVCYYGAGYQDSAIPAYKQTLKISPKYAQAANNLGVIYFNKNQYDTAITYFMASYNADPSNQDALMNIGAAYQNEKKYTLALHYDSLVLRKNPGSRQTLTNLSSLHNGIGMQYFDDKEYDKALKEFSLALNYDSNFVNALGNIGAVYQKEGNIEMAKNYYRKALAKDPNNPVFIQNLQLLSGGHK